MTDHSRMEELLAGYALDALGEPEALAVGRELLDHLSSCPTCPALFRDLRETAADLALAVPGRPITPALHDRVVGAVRAESRPVPSPLPRGRLVQGLLAASVAVALGLAGLSVSLSKELGGSQDERRRDERALALVTDPATRVASMTGTGAGGRIALAARPDGRAVLIGTGLRLPAGRIFEIWRQRGSALVPVDTFAPTDGRAVVELPGNLQRGTSLAITVERQRVDQPTTEPVFQGSLPS